MRALTLAGCVLLGVVLAAALGHCSPAWAAADASLVWFTWSDGEAPIIAPAAWAEWAYEVGSCESGWNPDAVGNLGERGILQLSVRQQEQMARAGMDPGYEPDRLAWAISLWGWSGETWRRHWSCADLVGAP